MFLNVSLFEVNLLNFTHIFFFFPLRLLIVLWFLSFTTWFSAIFLFFTSHTPFLERNPFRTRYTQCDITSIFSTCFCKMDLAFFWKAFSEMGYSERLSECCDSPELDGSWCQVVASGFHQSKSKVLLTRAVPSLPWAAPSSPLYQVVGAALTPTWLIHSLHIHFQKN